MAIGQAAGTAAALAINGGTTPQSLDDQDLRGALIADGAYLG